ncbi:hypothetical protein [Sphingomonas sp. PAMC 26621]|uniref:hypothetical protein n=1 Tax=Sphingomonas sp. PAMC 26621 TaxID=1112213 RepID=UPI000289F880|nr:hypothetical protein [Sphingomonas sp. PAMC 26621]
MRFAIIAALALAGCAAKVTPPAVQIKTVTVTREVQRPCVVTRPARPVPLGALPTSLARLAAVLGAKLAEWSGPGGYGERADAAIVTCTRP